MFSRSRWSVECTWAPARRETAPFLAIAVALVGLALSACSVDDRVTSVESNESANSSPGAGAMAGVGESQDADPSSSMAAAGDPNAAEGVRPVGLSGSAGSGSDAGGLLTADATEHDFGVGEAGIAGPSFTWTLTNHGREASPIPVLTQENKPQYILTEAADFQLSNGCEGPIAPGGSCTLVIAFQPVNLGHVTSTITLDAGALGSVSLAALGNIQRRVTVELAGAGAGSVTSDPPGIDCGSTCSELVDADLTVTLTASTTNGSGSFFSGWSEGYSELAARVHTLYPYGQAADSVTATFSAMTNNLIFVSSEVFAPNLGSVAAYDAHCNRLATAAGINEASGNGFVAALSSSTTPLSQRFPAGVQGWVRIDGSPFATTLDDLFSNSNVRTPAEYDELGRDPPHAGLIYLPVLTGTLVDGGVGDNCQDWTTLDPSANVLLGDALAGPVEWVDQRPWPCDTSTNILCMGKARTAPLSVQRSTGKRMWLTNTGYVPGSSTPDAKCMAERPAGVAAARAYVSYADRDASELLDPNALYVRLDGIPAGDALRTYFSPFAGIWHHADGSLANSSFNRVWVGGLIAPGARTAGNLCEDWTSSSGAGYVGNFHSAYYDANLYSYWTQPCDSTPTPLLYCFEQ